MKKTLKPKNSKIVFHGIDNALENPKQDCLERAEFAKRIFDVIQNSPLEINVRIGLFGEWGTGKTTTMNFIKSYCQQSNQPFATVNPWYFKSREEAWNGFVSSIDMGMANWQGKKISDFNRQKFVKKLSQGARKLNETFKTAIGDGISSLILAPLEGMLEVTKEKVQTLLDNTLGDKRLFIFIDDLDRADFNVAYDFLAFLNEFCNFNRCIYIISLDKKMAAQVIQNKTNIDEGRAKQFLDKIINWSFDLPQPLEYSWKKLLEDESRNLHRNVDVTIMRDIVKYLPRNPRRFKHYLRYISSLHKGFLCRFNPEELNLRLLYLAQLLRLEFPEEFESLNLDDFVLKDLSNSMMRDFLLKERNKNQRQPSEIPEWETKADEIFKSDNDRKRLQRFKEIYLAVRGACHLLPLEAVRNNLFVVENPEPLTWKEYRLLIEQLFKLKQTQVRVGMGDIIFKNLKSIESIQEFLKMVVRDRNELLSRIADTEIHQEQNRLLNKVNKLTRLCDALLKVNGLFEEANPIFDMDIFKEWFNQYRHWAHFNKGFYIKIREKEFALLRKLIKKFCGIPMYRIQLYVMLNGRDGPMTGSEQAFNVVREELIKMAELALSNDLISRFLREGGIRNILSSNNENYKVKKEILYCSQSSFYSDKNLIKIGQFGKKARTNAMIQRNFLDYIETIFREFTNPDVMIGETEHKKLVEIIKHDKFIDLFWKPSLAASLNPRYVGTLEQLRQGILKQVFKDDVSALPIPTWYSEIVKLYEMNKGEQSKQNQDGVPK